MHRSYISYIKFHALPVCDCDFLCVIVCSAEEDLSCAVVNERDCEEGTTLKSVGPRGRTQCVQGMVTSTW